MHRAVVAAAVVVAALLALAPLGGGASAASSSGANGDIVYVHGGTLTLVTGGSLNVTGSAPAFSPDGKSLAFVGAGGTIETCTVATCSGSVSDTHVTGSSPAWSPDATKLAYVTAANEIHVMTTSGGSDTTITSGSTDAHPSWSPDGTKIAFDRSGALETVTYPGGTVSSVSTSTSGNADPAWSPDGLLLAYVATSSGHGQVYVVSASGGTATWVTANSTDTETAPNWSPDGESIVYADASVGIESVTQGTGGTWGTPTQRTSTTTDATPDWQTVAPVAVTAPTIGGGTAPETGDLLTATNGTWQGATSYTYQWRRCNSSGASCSSIGAATAQTYAVASADVGSTLEVVVTATNAAGSTASSPSAATGVVVAAGTTTPPSNTAPPTVSLLGTDTQIEVGDTVYASTGTWTGSYPITYSYQWTQCPAADPLNGPCYSILGATSSYLVVPPSLYGLRIRIRVTATNGGGTVGQSSAATDVVGATIPRITVTPPIVGNNMVGQTLSVASGTWQGSTPQTYAYEWRRCDPYGNLPSCVPIAGATTQTYVPTPDDIGAAIRVYITATNVGGSVVGITNHTYPIVDRPHYAPSATTQPAVAGFPVVGGQLTGSVGVFAGDTPIATTFEWQRCDAVGLECRGIPAVTKTTYVPEPLDIGSTLRLAVWAKNAYGSIVAVSQTTDPVLGLPPHRRGRRIVGTPRTHYLHGTPYDDVIVAGPGNVTIDDPGGYNRIYAGSGRDLIVVRGPGSTHVYGGTGSATIEVANGYPDKVTCIGKHDRVVADPFDVVTNCAVVVRGGAPGAGSG